MPTTGLVQGSADPSIRRRGRRRRRTSRRRTPPTSTRGPMASWPSRAPDLVEAEVAGRAVERGVAVVEDAAVGRQQPVTVAARRGDHVDKGIVEGQSRGGAVVGRGARLEHGRRDVAGSIGPRRGHRRDTWRNRRSARVSETTSASPAPQRLRIASDLDDRVTTMPFQLRIGTRSVATVTERGHEVASGDTERKKAVKTRQFPFAGLLPSALRGPSAPPQAELFAF